MDLLIKKAKYFLPVSLLNLLLTILLSISSNELPGQNSAHTVRGRVTNSDIKTPLCFAVISSADKTSSALSNQVGEFLLDPPGFPVTLRVSKFGFNDKTITLNNPCDSVSISLTPLEIHKNSPVKKEPLEFGLILVKAIGKLDVKSNLTLNDNIQRMLVYRRIITQEDSTFCSFFESYADMNVSSSALLDDHPLVSRYASTGENARGLSENNLDFNVEPYVTLPLFIDQFIVGKGYATQNNNLVAFVRVDLGSTKNTYYINFADTSIIYIVSQFNSTSKNRVEVSQEVIRQERSLITEVSFSRDVRTKSNYLIDRVSQSEKLRVNQKNKPEKLFTKSTIFAIVPDPSVIYNAVRDQALHEILIQPKQQIDFTAKHLISDKSTVYDSEVKGLLLKPYFHDFWIKNSFVLPDSVEEKQIRKWKDNNSFYSESHITPSDKIIGIDSLVRLLNNNLVVVENVYLETDRSDYFAGDTIWLSAFILDNLHMDSTYLSKILYVDLINTGNKLEKHLKLYILNGRARGDIALDKNAKNGIYRLRAYTQYMRNFQGEFLFEKDITVHHFGFNNRIIIDPIIERSSDGDSVELSLRTILPDEFKPQNKRLEVFVRLNDTMSVTKTFNFEKDLNGSMGFYVPSSLHCSFADVRLTLSGINIISEKRISLPLRSVVNLQFFPESGKLVDGIETEIAYKAADEKGEPIDFSADIVDENQNAITSITGDSSGIGKFLFTPEFNHFYKALLTFSGIKYVFDLPVIEPTGFVLNFNSGTNDISIRSNRIELSGKLYLLISERGAVYASIEIKPENKTLQIHLPLEMYPKGIVQITLFDSLFRPLAERLVFNNRSDQKLSIHVETDKKEYLKKEKVNLTIYVTDAAGKPVESSLSLAVTDAAKDDSIKRFPDIESYLYLTSELKGKIDYSMFNLSDTSLSGRRKTDLVMMTQGWRNFLWNSIRYSNTLKQMYPIEKGFYLSGSVFNYNYRKQNSNYKINYLDFKSGLNDIVNTDENNRFKIEIPVFYNTHFLILQNRNKKERIDNLGFALDTFPVPSISLRKNELPFISNRSGYINAQVEKYARTDTTNETGIKYINLAQVDINAKSHHPWYTVPVKTINLDKEDPTGKKYSSLFQMIYEEFGEKAFTASGFGTKGNIYNPILVVNGNPMTAAKCPPCYAPYYNEWAASIPINEISDVMFYEAGSNISQWLTPEPPAQFWVRGLYLSPISPQLYLPVVSFKTYSNSYRGNPRGTIVFPFQGIYQAREFYQPDYQKISTNIPDNRATIYWNPELTTDSTGKASISFYNSDLKGKALIRVSGVSFSLKDASSATSQYLSY